MPKDKDPKFTKNGAPDGRGHAEGSRATRYTAGDGRRRPGRRKGARDLKTIVERVRELPVKTTGKNHKDGLVNTQEGIFLAQRTKALNGDTKAAGFLQEKFDRFEVPTVNPNEIARLLEEDADILAAALGRGLLPPIAEQGD